MNGIPDQPRPVVDAAATETKTGRIIAAVSAVLAAIPATLIEFEVITWTAGQVAQYGVILGLGVALALVLAGEKTKQNALAVEAQVTPIASPQMTLIQPLSIPEG